MHTQGCQEGVTVPDHGSIITAHDTKEDAFTMDDMDSPLFETDDFRIWCMKVIPCTKRFVHDWTVCPFAHAGEKAVRRDPRSHTYTGIACPDMKDNGGCIRGDACPYAHNVFEYWLHPTRYRTQLCNDGPTCKRKICFFAHDLSQLRNPKSKPYVSPEVLAKVSLDAIRIEQGFGKEGAVPVGHKNDGKPAQPFSGSMTPPTPWSGNGKYRHAQRKGQGRRNFNMNFDSGSDSVVLSGSYNGDYSSCGGSAPSYTPVRLSHDYFHQNEVQLIPIQRSSAPVSSYERRQFFHGGAGAHGPVRLSADGIHQGHSSTSRQRMVVGHDHHHQHHGLSQEEELSNTLRMLKVSLDKKGQGMDHSETINTLHTLLQEAARGQEEKAEYTSQWANETAATWIAAAVSDYIPNGSSLIGDEEHSPSYNQR